jgi:hypothetical protein
MDGNATEANARIAKSSAAAEPVRRAPAAGPTARRRRSALLGTDDCVETNSTEQIIGFRSNRHTPERASPQRGGGYTCRAIVAESQPSHQPAHVNRIVRHSLSSAPAAIARIMSQTSAHPKLYAL